MANQKSLFDYSKTDNAFYVWPALFNAILKNGPIDRINIHGLHFDEGHQFAVVAFDGAKVLRGKTIYCMAVKTRKAGLRFADSVVITQSPKLEVNNEARSKDMAEVL